jgi:hypothetical protein
MVLMPTSQLDETERVRLVGLGRVELPTNGLGKQIAVLTGSENFGLYYIPQQVPRTAT